MWQPSVGEAAAKSRWRRRVLGAGLVSVAALFVPLGEDAFVLGSREQPVGICWVTPGRGSVPEPQVVCRAIDGELATARPTWNPKAKWKGEPLWEPSSGELKLDSRRSWFHLNADGKSLGRLASVIKTLLIGRNSPLYHPKYDVGAFVVVTNCEKVRVAGKRYHTKLYFRNLSRRPGHLKIERFSDLQKRFPERIVMKTVWGMLDKTPKMKEIFQKRLKLFAGPNHNYYHKDPYEWPMHTIKDITRSQTLPQKMRAENVFLKNYERNKQRQEERALAKAEMKLDGFKDDIMDYAETLSEEQLAAMTMPELIEAAKEARYQIFMEANPDAEPQPKPVLTWPGSSVRRKRLKKSKHLTDYIDSNEWKEPPNPSDLQ